MPCSLRHGATVFSLPPRACGLGEPVVARPPWLLHPGARETAACLVRYIAIRVEGKTGLSTVKVRI